MFDRNYSRGYDFRRNLNVEPATGRYATDLFTEEAVRVIGAHDNQKPLFLMVNHLTPHAGNEDVPMQAKQEDIDRFPYIQSMKRRKLAGMIYALDQSVGQIVRALKTKDLIKDSIIIFYSDNGGPTLGLHSTEASNYPLRGVSKIFYF
jgi:arylsulfatase B